MKKRVSAALLSLFLTMGMIITPAKALNPTETYGDFQYEVRGEEIAITGYTGRSEQLVIPSEIQNKPVTIIAGSTFQKNVSQLKSIYFPKTLKDYSFGNICLEHLQSIYVAEENTVFRDLDGVLFTKDGTTLLRFPYGRENYAVPPNTTEIVSYAFSASLLKSVILPDTITTIPLGAFFGCSELEVIKFPSNLRKIASQAFNYCNQLKQIVLPDGLQTVGDHAFGECKQLQRLYIPEGVTLVANSFIGCSNLQNVMLERDVELGFHCFYGTPKDCNYYVWPDTEAERDLANMGFTNLYVLTAAQGDGAALLGLQDVNTPNICFTGKRTVGQNYRKAYTALERLGQKPETLSNIVTVSQIPESIPSANLSLLLPVSFQNTVSAPSVYRMLNDGNIEKTDGLWLGTYYVTQGAGTGTYLICQQGAAMGDLDGDGSINIADVMEMCKAIARRSVHQDIEDSQVLRGDLDGDHTISIADVMEVCKMIARHTDL